MTSTSNVPLTQLSRLQQNQCSPASLPYGSPHGIATNVTSSQPSDVEDVWQNEEHSHADVGDLVGEREQVNLPKADGGKEAWLFLCGCFVIEALVWGRLGLFISYFECAPSFMIQFLSLPSSLDLKEQRYNINGAPFDIISCIGIRWNDGAVVLF